MTGSLLLALAVFSAGAARVDITPPADAALAMSGYAGRQQGHAGIHDSLYARAIVVDDGGAQAAIVSVDVIGFGNALWERIAQRVAAETGIARERLLLAAVHTHGAPGTGVYERQSSPKQTAYVASLEDAVVEAVRRARAALQPARIGFGTGRANVNVNRRARMAYGGWWLGVNPDGPSDKTVAVVKFESLSGKPIAIFSNYAVHGTVMGQQNMRITGDLPGAAARFVENELGGDVIALWTSGAAGDQNAIYGPGNDFDQVEVLGRILGEEIVRVARAIKTSPRAAVVRGAQKVVTCPGQKPAPGATRKDPEIRFVDAEPVDIRLSLIRIGDVAFAGVSGEVLTGIGTRLKKQSRLPATIMVTHANGSSGYLPDDAAYEQVSYEIMTARVKRGCAETAIVNGLAEMMK
jgi:neutral ceramidase